MLKVTMIRDGQITSRVCELSLGEYLHRAFVAGGRLCALKEGSDGLLRAYIVSRYGFHAFATEMVI